MEDMQMSCNLRIFIFLVVSLLVNGSLKDVQALSDGYILAGVYGGTKTALLDSNGEVVYEWDHSRLPDRQNGYSCYLLENGNLLRSGIAPQNVIVSQFAAPRQGVISSIKPDNSVEWSYTRADQVYMMHHDFKPMPNGNILGVSFVSMTKEDAVNAGIDSELFVGGGIFGAAVSVEVEMIFELKPDITGGNDHQIVWEWHILDHVVSKDEAAAHPEKFSGGLGPFFNGQWVHLNGIDYLEESDLIVFSSRVFSEFYIIDHSTTTEEARGGTGGNYGKGGDLLFRWGRRSNYGESGGYDINVLHCPTWVLKSDPGVADVLFFHNNVNSDMASLGTSEVIQVAIPVDGDGNFDFSQAFPDDPVWLYAPDSMHSKSMSSAIRMKSGNTVVHEAYQDFGTHLDEPDRTTNSRIYEVTQDGDVVWDYTVTLQKGNIDFLTGLNPSKIMYYPGDHPGVCKLLGITGRKKERKIVSDDSTIRLKCRSGRLQLRNAEGTVVSIYSLTGERVKTLLPKSEIFNFSTNRLPSGSYLVRALGKDGRRTARQMITVF